MKSASKKWTIDNIEIGMTFTNKLLHRGRFFEVTEIFKGNSSFLLDHREANPKKYKGSRWVYIEDVNPEEWLSYGV